MITSFKGFGENAVTFEADNSLSSAGVPVKITSDGKVNVSATGREVLVLYSESGTVGFIL